MKNFIQEKLKVKISVKSSYKLGKTKCLIGFDHFQGKMKVINDKLKLHHNKDQKIYINNDLMKKGIKIQKVINTKQKQ